MKTHLLTVLLLVVVIILIFCNRSIPHTATAQILKLSASSDTDVGGIISIDTTWSLSNSPYNLTSDIQVSPNVTLTIEPGVIVNGNGLSLQIWGTLNATGLYSSKIVFNDTRITPGTSRTTSDLFRINVESAIIDGGSVYRATGNHVHGSLQLTDSIIRNTIDPMYLWYPDSDCFIERNIFYRSKGISVGISGSIKVYIQNNVFYEQSNNLYTDSAVENWVAYGGSDKMIVEHNSFLSTDRVALALPNDYTSNGITAQNNFWNTTDTKIMVGLHNSVES